MNQAHPAKREPVWVRVTQAPPLHAADDKPATVLAFGILIGVVILASLGVPVR